ncbi:carbohydrate-binding domain protein, putative [Rhizoctonia solani AG-3 Rhs1AP]|uniref:CST complex subunit STN1 n=2 Tax=Rhizoctonia solani AG-3 TaxID=1086053 RepID=A0A074SAN9_9AGAM|nr:carbohydrate-binding domain protein, putative [Rhizoctonia solani AG-3 Rhs1AP]KEP53963.1 putative carbohydrate-binding domain protein [Rhizoctonia solani 123E]
MSTEDKPPAQNTLTVDEVRSYILRADATAPCSVADIHAVPEALKGFFDYTNLDIYWLGSVPCRTVHIVGLLVETVEYESRSIYLVDDGTASVNCLKKRPVRMTIEELGEGSLFHKSRGFEVGDTVSVIGKIEFYKKGRQVYVSSIEKCASSNAEPQHLLHVLEQHRNVYSRPFTIPPLPAVPSTPKKAARDNSQPSYASSMASSPITVTCSSPVVSPKKDKHRLRHPSRLRSKDLNENVFRMYLSHIIISTLPIPEYTSQDTSSLEPMLENVGSSTPRYSQTIAVTGSPTQTPTRPSRPPMDSIGSPTPRKPAGSLSTETSTTPTLGVTLSYLRRVQVLSDLARRVVDHVAHERDKAMRHAERSARAKYEASQLKTSERVVASSINASSEPRASKTARTKRLFEAALRTLVSEGELTLFDGPRRQVPSFSGLSERAALTPSGIWHDMTNTTTSSTMSTASTALNAPSCFDLETISEDDGHSTEILSDPSDSEDAYVPLTPQVLRPVMLAALRRSLLTQRGGVDLKSWTKALRSDGQWARIPDLVVKETIDTLREEEWISRVGPDRWDFTRGSWARSLKLS